MGFTFGFNFMPSIEICPLVSSEHNAFIFLPCKNQVMILGPLCLLLVPTSGMAEVTFL